MEWRGEPIQEEACDNIDEEWLKERYQLKKQLHDDLRKGKIERGETECEGVWKQP